MVVLEKSGDIIGDLSFIYSGLAGAGDAFDVIDLNSFLNSEYFMGVRDEVYGIAGAKKSYHANAENLFRR
jgi:hypothetical protein